MPLYPPPNEKVLHCGFFSSLSPWMQLPLKPSPTLILRWELHGAEELCKEALTTPCYAILIIFPTVPCKVGSRNGVQSSLPIPLPPVDLGPFRRHTSIWCWEQWVFGFFCLGRSWTIHRRSPCSNVKDAICYWSKTCSFLSSFFEN